MQFQVIYDLSNEGPDFLLVTALCAIAASAAWLIYPDALIDFGIGKNNLKYRRFLIIAFMLIWGTAAAFGSISEFLRDREIINGKNYRVIQGFVRDLKVGTGGKTSWQNFSVNGVTFRYTNYYPENGFRHTSASGGPLRNGLYVRIHYLDKRILKLEIAKDQIEKSVPR